MASKNKSDKFLKLVDKHQEQKNTQIPMNVKSIISDIYFFSTNIFIRIICDAEHFFLTLLLAKLTFIKHTKHIKNYNQPGIKGLKILEDNTEFIKRLMEHKMLTVKAEENVIRLFPPLIVNNNELDEAISKIEIVCKEMN